MKQAEPLAARAGGIVNLPWFTYAPSGPRRHRNRRSSSSQALAAHIISSSRQKGRTRLAAIDRSEAPLTKPLDISSRSAKVSTRRARRLGTGLMPSCERRCAKMDEEVLPNNRPISFRPSPRCHRSQISELSAAVNLRLCLIVHLTSPQVKCCADQLNPRWKTDISGSPTRQFQP
jgi:hypothetical protein